MFECIDHQPGNNQPEADGLRRRDQVLWASTVIETAWMSPTIDTDRPEQSHAVLLDSRHRLRAGRII